MPTQKETGRNRNNEYVHQTIESYLEWLNKAYPAKKSRTKNKYRKTTKPEDYIFKRDYKEIILTFD